MATMKDVGAAYVAELFHAGASLGEAVDALDAIVAAHDAEVARKTLEDAADDIEVSRPTENEAILDEMDAGIDRALSRLRARAASISIDKAGAGDGQVQAMP